MALAIPGGGGPFIPGGYPGAQQVAYHPGIANRITNTPDYAAILDRLMAPIRARYDAAQKALLAQTDFSGALGRDNARLAQQGLDVNFKTAMKTVSDTLQAHGLASSGDLSYRHGLVKDEYKRASALGANQLLSYLTQLKNQLEDQQRQAQDALAEALAKASEYTQENYTPTAGWNPYNTMGTQARKPINSAQAVKLLGF